MGKKSNKEPERIMGEVEPQAVITALFHLPETISPTKIFAATNIVNFVIEPDVYIKLLLVGNLIQHPLGQTDHHCLPTPVLLRSMAWQLSPCHPRMSIAVEIQNQSRDQRRRVSFELRDAEEVCLRIAGFCGGKYGGFGK